MDQQQIDKSVETGISAFFSRLMGKEQPVAIDKDKLIADATASVRAEVAVDFAAERTAREAVAAEFSAFKAANAGTTNKARADQAILTLKTAGAWVPAYDKLGVPQLFSALAERDETITFSDANNAEQKPDLLTAVAAIFSAVGKIVPAGQISKPATTQTAAALAEVNGTEVDADSATFSSMVNAHATEKNIPYTQAYQELSAQGKRPTAVPRLQARSSDAANLGAPGLAFETWDSN